MSKTDWTHIERLMRRSKIGEQLSAVEMEACEAAYKADTDEYARRSRAVAERLRDRIASTGGWS